MLEVAQQVAQINGAALVLSCSAIGAAIAVFTGIGAGLGQGLAAAKGAEAVGRQPEAKSEVITTMLLGAAVAETTAIYGFVIAILLIFANPFVGMISDMVSKFVK